MKRMAAFSPLEGLPLEGSPRVLIVRIGAMGDVLHALPAVAALREHIPAMHLGWAIEPRWASLLAAHTQQGTSLVNRIHLIPVREWKAKPLSTGTAHSILALRRELRAEQYDVVVDLQGTIRSSFVGRLAGAAVFVGSATPRETPAGIFYTQKVALQQPHVVEQACEILGAATELELKPAVPVLAQNPAAESWCNGIFSALPESARSRVVVISAGGGWGAKRWPAERFGAVSSALHLHGYTILVAAANDEDELAHRVVESSAGAAQRIVCDLPQLTALLRRAVLFIAGDTGPLHLAAAVGTSVVGIYGPTDPARNGPFTQAKRILRSPQSATDHSRHAAAEAGLLSISAEDVIHSAMELLKPAE
jgi:heptosyltransferase-1